ncbi:MAG: glycosyltransferase family 4 protein [Candidatus Zixiibacteriota bacterium]|jgi:glycosyltransferase involved in cell wall biosynthesis
MKRLLVCSSTFPLGAEDRRTARFVYDLAAALAEYFEVTALVPHHPGAALAEKLGPVEVRRFKYFLPSSAEKLADGTGIMANAKRSLVGRAQVPFLLYWFRRAVERLLGNVHFDAVNTHWIVPAGWAAGEAASRVGARHLLTIHAADVFFLRRLPRGPGLARKVIDTADAVFTDSEFILAETSKLVGSDVAGTATTAGVNAAAFAPAYPPEEAKKRLGWPPAPTILYVGKMVEKKGLVYLIRALPEVRTAVPGVRLVLAGDGPLRPEMEALARRLGVDDVADFIGPKSHDELKLMYNAADVLAVPSIVARDGETEGMPTVILEAFAAGCPVVGSRVAGIPEFVVDGRTGYRAEAEAPADLAAKLIRTLGEGRERFSAACRAAAAERDFSRLAELYAEAGEA